MGTYGLQNVMQLWELEKLTPEQTIGQLLQLLAEFEERISELEKKVSSTNERKTRKVSRGNNDHGQSGHRN